MPGPTPRAPSIVLTLALAGACGGGDKASEPASIAKALSYESKERKAAEAAEARAREEAAKKKAEQEAKARALSEAIDQAAVLPEKMPKKLADACVQVAEAYEGFMRANRDAKTVSQWFDKKTHNIVRTRTICMKGTLEGAACLAHALAHAPDPLLDEGEDGVRRLKDACAAKFGVDAGKPPAAP